MLILFPTILMHLFLLSFPTESLNSERISEVLKSEKINPMKKHRSTREIQNEELDPGKVFESAVQLLNDIKPDLLKFTSSLMRKRRAERHNVFPPDHLPNCKDEIGNRCHRTRHMKRKRPHNAAKQKKYNLPKREGKRTVAAVKGKTAYPKATTSHRRPNNSTVKSFDYEDMIFTPTMYEDITATQPGVFDSIIYLFGNKQATRSVASTIEGFELPSEFQPSVKTEQSDEVTEQYRLTPQMFLPQPPANRNQMPQAVQAPQVFQSNRNQNLQPANTNQNLQAVEIPQAFPFNRNQITQPVQTPQAFQFNRNQILQPANRNQISQTFQTSQVLKSRQPIWSESGVTGNFQQPQVFQSRQPIWKEDSVTGNFQQPQVFQSRQPIWKEDSATGNFQQPQQLQPMENKNMFLPRYNRGPIKYPDRNYRGDSWVNDDYATSGQVALKSIKFKTHSLPENNPIGFQNDIDANAEDSRLVLRSSNSFPESQDHTRKPLQETLRNVDTDFRKSNRAAQVREAHIGALDRENSINLEISNASRQAEIQQARLEQYLNNYEGRRIAVRNKLNGKSVRNSNETVQRKEISQDKQVKKKAYITLKPASVTSPTAHLRQRKKTKSFNYYPRKRYSDSQILHQSGHSSNPYWKDNSEQEASLFNDLMDDVYYDEPNYEAHSTYYY
ncbi:hypothetical protein AVEN_7707-1 [Araneus ventricosus]|uniref:Uncharacterized protein n=1 Tax=Araneus ventricosus TaxID=182803 RepID=A0A4Y2JLL9_ARAVE|nr:hypothetical protein AVEN_7707-1 [Araneus ventricosus]